MTDNDESHDRDRYFHHYLKWPKFKYDEDSDISLPLIEFYEAKKEYIPILRRLVLFKEELRYLIFDICLVTRELEKGGHSPEYGQYLREMVDKLKTISEERSCAEC